MSGADDLGLLLKGKQLQKVPPNATPDVQTGVINDIIDRLNTNQQSVKTETVNLAIDGTLAQQVFTYSHNLGYVPRVVAFLNNVNVTITVGLVSTVYKNVNYPLPNQIGAFVAGSGGGGGISTVEFQAWLEFFVSSTNLYFHVINAQGLTVTLPITYTLTRDQAT